MLTKQKFKEIKEKYNLDVYYPSVYEDIPDKEKIDEMVNNLKVCDGLKKDIKNFIKFVKKIKKFPDKAYKNFLFVGINDEETILDLFVYILCAYGFCENISYRRLYLDECSVSIPTGVAIYYRYENICYESRNCDNSKYITEECANIFKLAFVSHVKYESMEEDKKNVFPFLFIEDRNEDRVARIFKLARSYKIKLTGDKKKIKISDEDLEKNIYSYFQKMFYNIVIDDKALKTISFNEIYEKFIDKSLDEKEEIKEIKENIKLDELIGLGSVKENINRIIRFLNKNKSCKIAKHMAFLGNPGTGKTTVARCLAKKLYENGIIKKNLVVETDREGLIGEYIGHTACKTKKKIKEALGGILFIDEAYALHNGIKDSKDYGPEAIAILVKAMEDYRDELIVIFAGYTNETKKMIDSNIGLRSRIPFITQFEDYDSEELIKIFNLMLKDYKKYTLQEEAINVLEEYFNKKRNEENFANARVVRNSLEKILLVQSRKQDYEISEEDVKLFIHDEPIEEMNTRIIGFAC